MLGVFVQLFFDAHGSVWGAPVQDPNAPRRYLDIVIQRKFVRVWAETYGVRLTLALVPDERLDQSLGEDVALEQECVVVLEARKSFLQ